MEVVQSFENAVGKLSKSRIRISVVANTTDLYTFSFVSSLIQLRSQILPLNRPNAALVVKVLQQLPRETLFLFLRQ